MRFHWENAFVLVVALSLFSIGPASKKLFLGAYPIGLVGVLYDTMKLVQNAGLSATAVHLCDLRAHELSLFGVITNGERVTLHDWWQAHSSPWLDAICAVPYGTFIFVCAACAVWLYHRDHQRMLRFGWSFFALNVAGFVTYHLYPAAPPWYYHAYGCQVDMHAAASEGPNLARVDASLGIPYFAGMYGRASDVFGAMPSLHVAYALLVAVEGWALMRIPWRIASVAFFVLMSFSAVYLDHHWVLDAVAGVLYCLVVVGAARALSRLRLAWVRPRPSPMLEEPHLDGAP
jgi:membrane-associated phospholipid phosphatase